MKKIVTSFIFFILSAFIVISIYLVINVTKVQKNVRNRVTLISMLNGTRTLINDFELEYYKQASQSKKDTTVLNIEKYKISCFSIIKNMTSEIGLISLKNVSVIDSLSTLYFNECSGYKDYSADIMQIKSNLIKMLEKNILQTREELSEMSEDLSFKWDLINVMIIISCLLAAFLGLLSRLLIKQKNLISEQKEEIKAQHDLLFETNENLSTKNIQITDSLNYAKLIQMAILPSFSEIQVAFPESFIFFKPKDIVSGDFYWFSRHRNKEFIALVDCTGHGVPGAFMSMIGNTLLNQIVNEKEIFDSSEILLNLHKGVVFALSQRLDSKQEDGMEVSLCVFDKTKKEITICSTRQSVYIISGDTLIEEKGNLVSIGSKKQITNIDSFKSQTYSLTNNTTIYLSSDGYIDQFGGNNFKKYGSNRFVELLKSIHSNSVNNQKEIIEKTFYEWKGDTKQIDDITIIGIRI